MAKKREPLSATGGELERYIPLSKLSHLQKLDTRAYIAELHNVIRLIYAETEMRTAAKAKRLEILASVAERARDYEDKVKYQLLQAEVAQQPVVDARLIGVLVDALDKMRRETDMEDAKAVHAELTFLDDLTKGE